MAEDRFDAIVVGGGLAGLAAAYTMAEAGLEILVLERGDYSGAKNVTGGRLYVSPIREMLPELWAKAPLERFIAHEELSIMDRERSLMLRYDGAELAQEPHQSYSVLRAKFDRWLAKQVERKGAIMVTKTRVDDLIIENGKVDGVWAGGDELRADVVIGCDGVLSFIGEKAGLKQPGLPEHHAVGFKEIIELDRSVLEDRFNLDGNDGCARLYMGEVTNGMFGGGFLYTNQESISLGVVVSIKDLMHDNAAKVAAPDLLDQFKARPEVARLIKGGQTAEYSAHVVPEGGLKALSKLCGNGILLAGDAAGFSMNIGITVRGMEYALASGVLAGKAVIAAKERGDYGEASLSEYRNLLDNSFVMKDFANFKHSPEVLETPRFFNYYPHFVGDLMRDIYEIPTDRPKARLYPTIRKYIGLGSLWAMGKDFWKVRKI